MSNHIKNIAIVGATGRSGRTITEALLQTGRFNVTALTREGSDTSAFPSSLHAVKPVDYSSISALTSALNNQDVLIITLAVTAPPEVQFALVDAAVAAGVKYIMPNQWGGDLAKEQSLRDTHMWDRYKSVVDHIERTGQGKTAWIGCACSFWYEFSLAGTEARYGFDFEKKEVTMYSGGNVRISTTTFAQVGRAVASLLSLPLTGQKPSLADYANKQILIQSFCVSQQDMFESVLRVTGDKKEDWTVKHEDVEARYHRGNEILEQGKFVGFGILLYARAFYKEADGGFEGKLDNEVLGLPKEDFDQATKLGVQMATAGETNEIK